MEVCLTVVFGCGVVGKGDSLIGLIGPDDSWALWWCGWSCNV